MDILKKASAYEDTIHFEIGAPDLPPSPNVQEALLEAVKKKRFFYTPSDGLFELKERICRHYEKVYNVKIDPANIFITPGSSGAFLMAYALTLDSGMSLGMSDPGYPAYKNIALTLAIEPKPIKVYPTSNYCIQPDQIEGIDALQISNPANPTGTIYDDTLLFSLIDRCAKKGVHFICDELYHGLTYETTPQTALAYSKDIFVVSGFSKYFCMPGLRLGWLYVPDRFVQKAHMLAQNLFLSAPTLSQYAALEAFDYDYLKKVRATYQKRRDFLYDRLIELFTIPVKPQGAFYIWADVSRFDEDSFAFAEELLNATHVAITPGRDFGTNETHRFVRFAFTNEIEMMEEGIERIRRYLRARSAAKM